MPARTLLSWLHLSDLHFGHPSAAHGHDRQLVLAELRKDLKRWGKGGRPRPGHVIVTGDVAFQGAKEEFEEAGAVFADVARQLDVSVDRFHLVPGNHDVVRGTSAGDHQVYYVLDAVRGGGEPTVETVLERKPDVDLLGERYAEFLRFAEGTAQNTADPGHAWEALVEGAEGLRVRLVGLDTALLVHEAGDHGKLRLGGQQLAVLARESSEPVHLTLSASHHPPRAGWLADEQRVHRTVRRNAHAHLSGHVHQASFERWEHGGGESCLWIGAGAVHEDVRRGGEPSSHGYNVAAVVLREDRSLVLHIWPRRWIEEHGKFGSDPANTPDDGVEYCEFELGETLPAADEPPPPEAPARRSFVLAALGVEEDLGEELQAVRDRLERLPDVAQVVTCDAAATDEPELAAEPDRRLVLLGGRAGGTDRLERWLGERPAPIVLLQKGFDTDDYDPDDMAAAHRLRKPRRDVPSFKTSAKAAELAARAVHDWILEQRAGEDGEAPVLQPWEKDYLRYHENRWEEGWHGPLRSVSGDQNRLTRADLYVSLRAERDLVWLDKEGELQVAPEGRKQRVEDAEALGQREQAQLAHLEQALSHPDLRSLVIEGEPGAGKSVLLQHVAFTLARHRLGGLTPDHRLDLEALRGRAPLAPIPFLIDAKDLADSASREQFRGLAVALASHVRSAINSELDESELLRGLDTGRYLVLIDSLDEVPGITARRELVRCLEGAAKNRSLRRFVLTTRPTAYLGALDFKPPLRRLRVASLGAGERAGMVEQWCAAHHRDRAYRENLGSAVAALRQRYGRGSVEGADLAENPLLLTCVFLVYAGSEQLPESVAALYQQMIEILCQNRSTAAEEENGGASRAGERRELLAHLFELLQELGGTARPVDEVAEHLRERLSEEYGSPEEVVRAIDALHRDTGLVRFEDAQDEEGRPQRRVRPWHRSFQEYLCACRLAERGSKGGVAQATDQLLEPQDGRRPVAFGPSWVGVLRFLVGAHGRRGHKDARSFVERLHELARGRADIPREEGRLYALVTYGLAEYRREYFKGHPLLDTLPAELLERFEARGAGWHLRDRLMALDALGWLGDPRLEGDPWVAVEGATFTLGGDEKAPHSAPAIEVEDPPFRIAWRPVVVRDFEVFLGGAFRNTQNFHTPNVCLPSAGWETLEHTAVPFAAYDAGEDAPRMQRLLLQRGQQQMLVYYWFQAGDRLAGSEWAVRLHRLLDLLKDKPLAPTLIVSVYVPVTNGVEETEAAAQRFLSTVGPYIREATAAGVIHG